MPKSIPKPSKKVQYKKSAQKRRPWTPREDTAIRRLVEENGIKQWTLIAESLHTKYNIAGRSGKQCRERWHNHLAKDILKEAWTYEEDHVLFSTHQNIGNRWAEISNSLPGRTDNSIKNHFYSTVRKYYRKLSGKEGTAEELRENLKDITANILNELATERQISNEDENISAESVEDSQVFPDFSDMIITGQHISLPQDWCPLDFSFDEDQEILIFPMSPYEYSSQYIY